MDVLEWYFGFHAPHNQTKWGFLGHVEVFGYTGDETWFFLDPTAKKTKLTITHHHDQVEALIAEKFTICSEVIRTTHSEEFLHPIHFNMNCVTQCAALIGIRAFTPWGFRRKLLANNAKVIHAAQGRQRR